MQGHLNTRGQARAAMRTKVAAPTNICTSAQPLKAVVDVPRLLDVLGRLLAEGFLILLILGEATEESNRHGGITILIVVGNKTKLVEQHCGCCLGSASSDSILAAKERAREDRREGRKGRAGKRGKLERTREHRGKRSTPKWQRS